MTTSRKYTLKRDTFDARDFQYKATKASAKLPTKVDLSQTTYIPAIFDQGQLGSCTANAVANAYLFTRNKEGKTDSSYVPSRLFIYYNERAADGTVSEDAGSSLRCSVSVVSKQGACHEVLCPYQIKSFAKKPSTKAYADGLNYQALTYSRLTNALTSTKACLAAGYPFIMGIDVYENFESDATATTGIVTMPTGKLLGGHAVMCVGYDDTKKLFKVMNSWGDSWGDHGYFYLPYAYVTSTKLTSDIWTLRIVE
jgi:C1A family cysteine protease